MWSLINFYTFRIFFANFVMIPISYFSWTSQQKMPDNLLVKFAMKIHTKIAMRIDFIAFHTFLMHHNLFFSLVLFVLIFWWHCADILLQVNGWGWSHITFNKKARLLMKFHSIHVFLELVNQVHKNTSSDVDKRRGKWVMRFIVWSSYCQSIYGYFRSSINLKSK